MRRLLFVAVLAIVALAVGPAYAGPMSGDTIYVESGSNPLNGGPFAVDVDPQQAGYDFLTFCIEKNEFLALGGSYKIKIDTAADDGGVGGPSPDPLDSRTAYLFSKWALDATNYGPSWLSTDERVGMQMAIWRIEEEVDSTYSGLGATVAQIAAANGFFNDAHANANGSLYDVRVMQLWDSYNPLTNTGSGYHQDLLVWYPPGTVPTPDPMSSLAALGLGILSLASLKRRLRK